MTGSLPSNRRESISATNVGEVDSTTADMAQDVPAYNVQARNSTMEITAPAVLAPMDPRTSQPDPQRNQKLSGRECGSIRRVLEPPVTKSTLSELDVVRIVYNPKLRHDVNFDPDLCFRPNTDGEKGRKKMVKAREFWAAMERQLAAFMAEPASFSREHPHNNWCLPAALKSAREIIETLVPSGDRVSVAQILDIELIMQQFRQGTVDLVRLASWIADLLKMHCAPMRDVDVDDMAAIFCDRSVPITLAVLTQGVAKLLCVLEHMKLDIANHQIRCLRPLLINDTVAFEQKLFVKKIAMGKINASAAHRWFQQATAQGEMDDTTTRPRSQWDFMQVLLHMLTPLKRNLNWPATFIFDEDRLSRLRFDLIDLINLQVCMILYRTLDKQARIRDHQLLVQEQSMLISQVSLHDSQETNVGPSNFNSATGSNRSTGTLLIGETLPGRTARSASFATSHAELLRIRTALQAILANAQGPGPDRWATASSSLALQLLRQTSMPLSMLPQLESRLAVHLSNRDSAVYREAEQHVISELTTALRSRSAAYEHLDAMKIYENAMQGECLSSKTSARAFPASSSPCELDDIARIAKRIAHIGVLHWRTWAHLAYLVDPEMGSSSESETDSNSDSS